MDIDVLVNEDQSSVFVTPDLGGVLAAALWGAMKRRPEMFFRCLSCGFDWREK
jgi:hypothetical protein